MGSLIRSLGNMLKNGEVTIRVFSLVNDREYSLKIEQECCNLGGSPLVSHRYSHSLHITVVWVGINSYGLPAMIAFTFVSDDAAKLATRPL